MDNSWVKLYRKIGENDIVYDATALQVFVYLLIHVDKKTGTYRISRFQTSERLRLNSNTFKDVIKRLEQKYKIITTKSTNKYTEVSLLSWAKYQNTTSLTPPPTPFQTPTKHQQNTTSTRIENRDIENNGKPLEKPLYGNVEVNELFQYLQEKLRLAVLDDSQQTNRRYCWLLLKKFGLSKCKIVVEAAAASPFWHTKITSFRGLYYNAVKIVSGRRGEVRSIDGKKVLDHKDEGRKGIQAHAG